MPAIKSLILSYCLFFTLPCFASLNELYQEAHLYKRLSPRSLSQLASFAHLYPHSPEAREAEKKIQKLLQECFETTSLPSIPVKDLLPAPQLPFLQDSPSQQQPPPLLPLPFHNRQLEGHSCKDPQLLSLLPSESIDLLTALTLTHNPPKQWKKLLQHYHHQVDLLALNALTLSSSKEPRDVIRALNHYLFHELKFRFPPESLYQENIDPYTFLPSVIDQREGVCLGVCILYLCVAQRWGLSLEIVTPPGHIYLRLRDNHQLTNIETTARGENFPSHLYHTLNLRQLPTRTLKEVVGLSHINRASALWRQKKYAQTLEEYQKAEVFLPGDVLLKELTAYQYLFLGKREKGYSLLKDVVQNPDPNLRFPPPLPRDCLNYAFDEETLSLLLDFQEPSPKELEEKILKVETAIQRYPQASSLLFFLAHLHSQMAAQKKAIEALYRYQKMEPKDPNCAMMLLDYHLQRLEITQAYGQFIHLKALMDPQEPNENFQKLEKEFQRYYPQLAVKKVKAHQINSVNTH